MCKNTPFYDLNGDGKVDFIEREIEYEDYMQMVEEEERTSFFDDDEDDDEDGFDDSDWDSFSGDDY